MKPDKTEKTIIIILIILIIGAICSIYKRVQLNLENKKLSSFIVSVENETKLPPNIRELSKKYNAYEELYSSDQKTFVYGYDRNSFDKKYDEKFHKKLSERLKAENLNYRYFAIEKWEERSSNIEGENRQLMGQTCSDPSKNDLMTVLDISNDCISNSCIIDMKNHKYITISRDIDFIIKTLKKYNPPEK